MAATCSHIDAIADIKPARRRECEKCVKIGARWVHLRTCQTCDATLCCDIRLRISTRAGMRGTRAIR